ncbi:hypothetical protein BH23GEM9_BH23GEM9_33630 [soil metagenome]
MQEEGGVGIRKVGQIAMTVRDVARARRFYEETLGLKHLFDAPPRMSFFDCAGVRLLLGESEAGASAASASAASASEAGALEGGGASEVAEPARTLTIVYLDVADIRKAHEVLVSRGVDFESEPHHVADLGDRDLWLAFFRDSEANMLALMSEVPKS